LPLRDGHDAEAFRSRGRSTAIRSRSTPQPASGHFSRDRTRGLPAGPAHADRRPQPHLARELAQVTSGGVVRRYLAKKLRKLTAAADLIGRKRAPRHQCRRPRVRSRPVRYPGTCGIQFRQQPAGLVCASAAPTNSSARRTQSRFSAFPSPWREPVSHERHPQRVDRARSSAQIAVALVPA